MMPRNALPAPGADDLCVYYDGGCPLCSKEIAFYQSRPTPGITWVNVDACDASALGDGLTRKQAIQRLHVRRSDGTLQSGAAAFAALWRRTPGLKWLGVLLALPPFGWVAELAYRAFLIARKLWRPNRTGV